MVKSVEKRAYDVRTEADSSDVEDRSSADEKLSRSSSRTNSVDMSSHDQNGYVDEQNAVKEEPVVVSQVFENSREAIVMDDGKQQNGG